MLVTMNTWSLEDLTSLLTQSCILLKDKILAQVVSKKRLLLGSIKWKRQWPRRHLQPIAMCLCVSFCLFFSSFFFFFFRCAQVIQVPIALAATIGNVFFASEEVDLSEVFKLGEASSWRIHSTSFVF